MTAQVYLKLLLSNYHSTTNCHSNLPFKVVEVFLIYFNSWMSFGDINELPGHLHASDCVLMLKSTQATVLSDNTMLLLDSFWQLMYFNSLVELCFESTGIVRRTWCVYSDLGMNMV